jgi:SAM-dependent methyltransferase
MHDCYTQNAQKFFDQYESLDAAKVHASWSRHLPATKALILDVGAGSGRDARWLAGFGHEVVAVEPSAGLREKGRSLSSAAGVQWLSDSLPGLAEVFRLDLQFDLILLSAVWMHVAPGERERAFRKLVNLLRPGGKLVITLRHGPSPDDRAFHPVSSQELKSLAKGHVLEVVEEVHAPDQLGRPEVSWETLVFRLADDGTGALPLLRHVIINDAKSSTYKLALLRVLLRIADGAQGAVIARDDSYVTLPFGLVALYWVRVFKPLVLDAGFPQQPSANGGLGFAREGFRGLKEVSPYDLRVGFRFSGAAAAHLFMALKDARDTIQKMPAFYTTYPNSRLPVFPCEKRLFKRPSAFRLDSEFLASFGTFQVPRMLWDAMSRYPCWIEPAILSEWCSLMKSYDAKVSNQRPLDDYLARLSWLDPERDTRDVRAIIDNLCHAGRPVYCVWTGKRLDKVFDVDHCLPFAYWPNNDLWNLMPSDPKINNRKSGKLPAAQVLEAAEDRILSWWEAAYRTPGFESRFQDEAKLALPIGGRGETAIPEEEIFRGIQGQRLRLKVNQQLREWQG